MLRHSANDGESTVSFPDDVKAAYEAVCANTTNAVVVSVPETYITCTDVLGGKSVYTQETFPKCVPDTYDCSTIDLALIYAGLAKGFLKDSVDAQYGTTCEDDYDVTAVPATSINQCLVEKGELSIEDADFAEAEEMFGDLLILSVIDSVGDSSNFSLSEDERAAYEAACSNITNGIITTIQEYSFTCVDIDDISAITTFESRPDCVPKTDKCNDFDWTTFYKNITMAVVKAEEGLTCGDIPPAEETEPDTNGSEDRDLADEGIPMESTSSAPITHSLSLAMAAATTIVGGIISALN